MNRKLLVIAIVPLLVGLAGATAFSTFTGSIQKNITVTTGIAQVTEKVECVGAYIAGTAEITWSAFEATSSGATVLVSFGHFWIDGGKGYQYNKGCELKPECVTPSSFLDPYPLLGDPHTLGAPVEFLGPSVVGAYYQISISPLAPGDWVELLLIDSLGHSDNIPVTLSSALTPSPFAPATSTAPWTHLADPANPCAATYGVTSGASHEIDTGSPSAPRGLEYCDSGPLGPASTASSPVGAAGPTSLTPPGVTLYPDAPSSTYAYVLLGFDESAPNADMGITGDLVFGVTAAAV